MNITIKIDAPGLVQAIEDLAHSIGNFSAAQNCMSELIEKATDVVQSVQTEVPTHTFDQVKAILAEIARKGKQAEVKALLCKYGVSKLSDLPPDQLPAIMKDAEAIM